MATKMSRMTQSMKTSLIMMLCMPMTIDKSCYATVKNWKQLHARIPRCQ